MLIIFVFIRRFWCFLVTTALGVTFVYLNYIQGTSKALTISYSNKQQVVSQLQFLFSYNTHGNIDHHRKMAHKSF